LIIIPVNLSGNKIILKASLGFLNLAIMLGLSIFLPAQTLNYWQGWLYYFVFMFSCLLITIYFFKKDPALIQRRLKAGPTAETQKSQKIIQALSSIFFLGIFIVSGLDYSSGWSYVPGILSIIADIFAAIGFLIIFFVFKENSYTSSIIEVGSEQKVISTGPYGKIRHPMYSGAFLMLLVTPFALGSLTGLIPVIGIILSIILRLLDEEKYLMKNLPGYKEYMEIVRFRLIQGVW
jgi:protein-S-isoprenylcysteine O-methyltransferase Ste14